MYIVGECSLSTINIYCKPPIIYDNKLLALLRLYLIKYLFKALTTVLFFKVFGTGKSKFRKYILSYIDFMILQLYFIITIWKIWFLHVNFVSQSEDGIYLGRQKQLKYCWIRNHPNNRTRKGSSFHMCLTCIDVVFISSLSAIDLDKFDEEEVEFEKNQPCVYRLLVATYFAMIAR